jgi:hypothetical protein
MGNPFANASKIEFGKPSLYVGNTNTSEFNNSSSIFSGLHHPSSDILCNPFFSIYFLI